MSGDARRADARDASSSAFAPVTGSRWATPRRMVAAVAGRCPACGAPGAFERGYRLRRACPRCGAVFERDGGTWLGASVLAYALAVVAMGAFAWATVPGRGLYRGLEVGLLAVAAVTVALVYRPVKGWWLWATWAAGWVHRDREDPEAGLAGPAAAHGGDAGAEAAAALPGAASAASDGVGAAPDPARAASDARTPRPRSA